MRKHVGTKKMMTKHIKKVVVCKGVLLKATAPIKESFYQQTRGLLLLELRRSSVVERQLDALLNCYVLYQRYEEKLCPMLGKID